MKKLPCYLDMTDLLYLQDNFLFEMKYCDPSRKSNIVFKFWKKGLFITSSPKKNIFYNLVDDKEYFTKRVGTTTDHMPLRSLSAFASH